MRGALMMASVGLLVSGLGWVGPARAQEAGAQRDDTDPRTVTVTARRREESLQNVPAAGTVISGDALAQAGITNAADLLRQLPATSLVVSGSAALSDISMRGQGVGRLGASETSTGIYRNGIFVAGGQYGGRSFSRLDLFDVAQVESFRGPQGALYGRNAVGGSINIVSAKPGPAVSFSARGEYEVETDRRTVESIVNLPLSDTLAFRAGGFYVDQRDGFYRDADRNTAVDAQGDRGLRFALGWRPDPATTVTLTAEGANTRIPSTGSLAYAPTSGDPDPYTRRNLTNLDDTFLRERTLFLEVGHSFSGAKLSVIGNARWRDTVLAGDDYDHFLGLGAFPQADLRTDLSEKFARSGGEVRLASDTPGGRFRWLIGADAQHSVDRNLTVNSVLRNTFSTAAQRATVTATASNRRLRDVLYSWSAFGSLAYDVVSGLEASVEARYQHDLKKQNGLNNLLTATFPVARYGVADSYQRVTPAATLRYAYNGAGSVYARFATGYRPGGFNDLFLFQGVATPNRAYGVEYTKSYEIGWKTDLLGRRLSFDIAAFIADTSNVQLVSRDPASSSTQRALINAGDSTIKGIEADLRGRFPLGRGSLSIVGGLSTNTGHFSNGSRIVQTTGALDLSDGRVPRTRDIQGNLNLTLREPIGSTTLILFAGYQGASGGVENLAGSVNATGGLPLAPYSQVDLRASIDVGKVRASIFGKNVGDFRYRTQALSTLSNSATFGLTGTGYAYFYNEPRTYGVELSVRF